METLLYSLSKTSKELVNYCNSFTQREQRALGFFVLITSLFAFISSYYALTSIFGEWDSLRSEYYLNLKQTIIVSSIAILYAITIGAIDREIVSAHSKWAALLRLPMAMLIGMIIAIPLEIKIFENKINQQIVENHNQKMIPFKNQKDEFLFGINQEILEIETKIDYYSMKKDEALQKIRGEDLGVIGSQMSGISGKGRYYRYALKEKQSCESEINKLEARVIEKKEYRKQRLSELEKDFTFYKTDMVYDLWEKYQVMHQIIREDKTGKAKLMSYGLSILFILIELIPSIVKLINKENEYSKLLVYVNKQSDIKLKNALEDTNFTDDSDEYIRIPEIRFEV